MNKERIWKAARQKCQVTYKGNPIKIIADFSRNEWNDVFQIIKKITTNLDYLSKLHYVIEGETKNFHDKQKLRQFITTKLVVKRYLKESYKKKRKRIAIKKTGKNKYH
jgi:hypothetical protein